MNHAGPSRGRSPPAHPQPQGTSTAGRPSRYSWPSRVGGSCPCDPQNGLPAQNAKRFEQANPRPRPTPPATVLGSRGVAGGRAASAPPVVQGRRWRLSRPRGHSQENTRTGFVAGRAALGFKSKTTGGCAALLASLPLGFPLGEKAGAAPLLRRACASAKTR